MAISIQAQSLRAARRGRLRKAPVAVPKAKQTAIDRKPETLQARKLALQAFELRAAGANDLQVAEKLDVPLQKAKRALETGMQLVQQHTLTRANDVAKMECARIDRMRMALWSRCMKGDDKAIRTYLLLMDQRAKYTAGIYAETRSVLQLEANGAAIGKATMIESAGLLQRLESLAGADAQKRKLLDRMAPPPEDLDVDIPEDVIDAWDVGAELVDVGQPPAEATTPGSIITVPGPRP